MKKLRKIVCGPALRSNRFEGFSLMELLIVVGLMGILIAIAVVSYSSAQKKSRDSRRQSDLKAVQNAMEQYYADNSGSYPTSVSLLTPSYLVSGWPKDPKTNAAYDVYPAPLDGSRFCVCALLEGTTTGGNATDLQCGTSGTTYSYYCVKNQQ